MQTSVVSAYFKSSGVTTGITNPVNNKSSASYKIRLDNFPNPFNGSTDINFFIPEAGKVILTVTDIRGKKIISLLNETIQAGNHSVKMNSEGLSAGVYFYRMQTAFGNETHKMVVVK